MQALPSHNVSMQLHASAAFTQYEMLFTGRPHTARNTCSNIHLLHISAYIKRVKVIIPNNVQYTFCDTNH